MSVLVLVPARGGSKGLPGKNLLPVGGLSLTARAVLAGRAFLAQTRLEGAVVVDTDDEAIAAEGRRYGADVPFLRPAHLARDQTPTQENVLHVLDRLAAAGTSHDALILLQPTSPLRSADDIARCWAAYNAATAPSIIAVTPIDHPIELAVRRNPDGTLAWAGGAGSEAKRRQDFPPAARITGAVYVIKVALLRERRAFTIAGLTRSVELPAGRSVDVDTAADLALADMLARNAGPTPRLAIGGGTAGGGARCYLIAEAGVNHNGDTGLAHQLVDAAADAGADAVKFQTFDPERLASKEATQAAYQAANTGKTESQLDMLRRLVLPREAYPALQEHAARRGIAFLSTPFDDDSADFLASLNVPAFKVPSGELTNLPFIARVAAQGRPVLMSSGMATMAEVAEAVLTVRAAGAPLALFHCVTDYPAAPSACNLAAMASMRAAFGVPVGWSDHTSGIEISVAAAALGAELLEKHFTIDRRLPGPDHKASLEPAELRAMVAAVRAVEAARGNGEKAPATVELGYAALVRKSLHTRTALEAGHRLTARDLEALRPGTGLAPGALNRIVGRRIKRALPAGAMLAESDLE